MSCSSFRKARTLRIATPSSDRSLRVPTPVAADWQGKPRRILLRLQRVCIPDATRRRGLLDCGSCSPPRAGMVSVPVQPPRRFPAGRKKGVSIPLRAGHLPCHCAEGLAYPLRVTNAFLEYFRHNLSSLVLGNEPGSRRASRGCHCGALLFMAHTPSRTTPESSAFLPGPVAHSRYFTPKQPTTLRSLRKILPARKPRPACTRTVSWTLFGAGRARLG